jgi:uncharacterized membrane protein
VDATQAMSRVIVHLAAIAFLLFAGLPMLLLDSIAARFRPMCCRCALEILFPSIRLHRRGQCRNCGSAP